MTVVTQDIKISCQNSIIKGAGAKSNDGHPWRNWKITLVAMEDGKEVKGKLSIILDHVEYILHPTFEDPRRVKYDEPYILQEKGWGEFDLRVVLYFTDEITDPQVLLFDLNFALSNYSTIRTVKFPNASPELKKLLAKEPCTASPPLRPRKGGKKPMSASLEEPTTATKKPKNQKQNIASRRSTSPKSPGYNDTLTSSNTSIQSSPYFNSSSGDSIMSASPSLLEHSNQIIDEVNNITEVYSINSIHQADIVGPLREEWNLPDINMMELVKRYCRLSEEQCHEFLDIIADEMDDSMDISIDNDGKVVFDIYTLGRSLLEKLWDYVADMATDDDLSFTSQDFHPKDLEFDSDPEENQDTDTNSHTNMNEDTYHDRISYSEERSVADNAYGNQNGNYSYEYANGNSSGAEHSNNFDWDMEELGFVDSDIASDDGTPQYTNGYSTHISNGYPELSDMDAQDEDDYQTL